MSCVVGECPPTFITKCKHDEYRADECTPSGRNAEGVVTLGYNGTQGSNRCQWCGAVLSPREVSDRRAYEQCVMSLRKRCEIDERRYDQDGGGADDGETNPIVSCSVFDLTTSNDARRQERALHEIYVQDTYDMSKRNIDLPKYATTKNCQLTLEKENLEAIKKSPHLRKWNYVYNAKMRWCPQYNKGIEKLDNYYTDQIKQTNINASKSIQETNANIKSKNMEFKSNVKLFQVDNSLSKTHLNDARSLANSEFQMSTKKNSKSWKNIIKNTLMKDITKEIISRNLRNKAVDTRSKKWAKLEKYLHDRKMEEEKKSQIGYIADFTEYIGYSNLTSNMKKSYNPKNAGITWIEGDIAQAEEYERSEEESEIEETKFSRTSKIMNRKATGFLNYSIKDDTEMQDDKVVTHAKIINRKATGFIQFNPRDLEEDDEDDADYNNNAIVNRYHDLYDERLNNQRDYLINSNTNNNTGDNTYTSCDNTYNDADDDRYTLSDNTSDNTYNTSDNTYTDASDNTNNGEPLECLTDDVGRFTSDPSLYQHVAAATVNNNNNGYYKEYRGRPRMVDKSTFVRPRNATCRCCEYGCPADSYESSMTRKSINEDHVYRAPSVGLLLSQPPPQHDRHRHVQALNSKTSQQQQQQQQQQQGYYSDGIHSPRQRSHSITSGILRPDRRGRGLVNSFIGSREELTSQKIEVMSIVKFVLGVAAFFILNGVYNNGVLATIRSMLGMRMTEEQDEVLMRYFENK